MERARSKRDKMDDRPRMTEHDAVQMLIYKVEELEAKISEFELRIAALEGEEEEEVLVDEEYVEYVEKTEAIDAIKAFLG